MSDEGFYVIEFDGRAGVAYCRHQAASQYGGAWEKWDILYLRDHGYPAYASLGSEDKAFAGLKIVAAVNERDALIAERDEWKEKAQFFMVQYQDEIGINGLKEERDAAVAERAALRQALEEAKRALRHMETEHSPEWEFVDGDVHYKRPRRALARIRDILGGENG